MSAGCESHPEADRVACERCGDFTCVACLPLDAPPRCGACRDRFGIESVPWERTSERRLGRWWATTRAFVVRPTRTLERTRPRRAWPALRYLLHTAVLVVVGGWMGVVTGALVRGDGLAVRRAIVAPVLGVGLLGVAALLRMLVFHACARGLGGTGTWGASVASVAYLSATLVVFVPVSFASWVATVAPLVGSLSLIAVEAALAVHLTTAARQYHGLTGGRAAMAGWGPGVLGLAVAVLGCGFLGTLLDAVALAE